MTQGTTGALWALALSGFQGIWKSKVIWFMLAISAVHVAIRSTIIIVAAIFNVDDVFQVLTASFVRDMLFFQTTLPLVVLLGTVGARVTARDRMMGGLEFLLSKAMPPWTYVAARSLAPMLAAVALVVVPMVVLSIVILMMDSRPANAGDLIWGGLAYSLLVTAIIGPLAAGLGTLVDNPRSATAAWLALAWLTLPLATAATGFGADWGPLVGPLVLLNELGGSFLGIDPRVEAWQGWLLAAALAAAPLYLLHRRTREVIA